MTTCNRFILLLGNLLFGRDVRTCCGFVGAFDLSELLQGEESGILSDYLTVSIDDFDNDGNLDTRLSVDPDAGLFAQPTQLITLSGTDLSQGGSLTGQQIIDKLLQDGNLDVDGTP